jgi:mRNA interferase MazF
MQKDFEGWHKLKTQLDSIEDAPLFNECEIWWCSVGMNVGFELYGKDDKFVRPILIMRKYSRYTFFGLPLTSKRKPERKAYLPFEFQKHQGSIILDQGKTYDCRRLVKRMGKIADTKVDFIREALREFI